MSQTNLFNQKYIKKQIAVPPAPDPARIAAFRAWANDIASGEIAKHSEVALHGPFVQKILVEGLGYHGPIGYQDAGHDHYNVTQEKGITRGSVDVAIGHFSQGEGRILAPFELKGADTKNLDAIMPGRAKTPVDQAWEYANNNVGSKWVLVSNYLEIRLYSYADGRTVYESFDLKRLHEPQEFARIQLLLSAESLLSGKTAELLAESKRENKDITDRLYQDYKALRTSLIGEVRRERPEMDPLEAIRLGQKILDRVLFVAFAEDNGLLPPKILEKAFETTNPFAPAPVWDNFKGLFRAIDEGSPPMQVPRYNGGLFAPDERLNTLAVPDHICEQFKALSEYDFASEVSVTVLGHIFEQSIADVEQLQAEARGEIVAPKKASGTSGRRKRDGVVYTPDYIARFIVEQTLGTHCREIFSELLGLHAKKGASADDVEIAWKSAKDERAFWEEYRARLAKLRIVDPACGSGVFLVMAFDWLKAELGRVDSRLVEVSGVGALFNIDSEILTHNLFGVDVNEESVEIAKLSLWIKTARHGKVLDSLDDNIRVGDSLIEDSSFAYRSHGFVWKEAFADIFAEGGFDVVLGNPPYVRQELLKDLKPYLKGRFEVFHGVADLYAYFFERGLRILKPGGRLGYISSSTFFKIAAGEALRNYVRTRATLEVIVDFGDHQIFEGVTTYPAIIVMRADEPSTDHELCFWNVVDLSNENFKQSFEEHVERYPQNRLSAGTWELESPSLRKLREKVNRNKGPLKSVFGVVYRGLSTGLNEAFVVNQAVRDQLVRDDPKSAEFLFPWLEGKDIHRWHPQSRQLWLILIKRGFTVHEFGAGNEEIQWLRFESKFPAIAAHIAAYEGAARQRSDQGDFWWELRPCNYYDKFNKAKVVSTKISIRPTFAVDTSNAVLSNTSYLIDGGEQNGFVAALLNSLLAAFYFRSVFAAKQGGFYEVQPSGLGEFPIPDATDAQKADLAALAERAQAAAEERHALQQQVARRIPDLASGHVKFSTKLKEWWTLPDFAAFQREVKKTLKADIPLKERNDWESWVGDNRARIDALSAEIKAVEDQINAQVYALFDLTPDEIALLEANI